MAAASAQRKAPRRSSRTPESISAPEAAGISASEPERYSLEVIVDGRPVTANHYQYRLPIYHQTTRKICGWRVTYTPEATNWHDTAAWLTRQRVLDLPADMPHPRKWPRPLSLDVFVRSNRCDVSNALKVLEDGVKHGLDVDDRWFEYDGIHREDGPLGVRIVIRSAPLARTSAQTTNDPLPIRKTRTRKRVAAVSDASKGA